MNRAHPSRYTMGSNHHSLGVMGDSFSGQVDAESNSEWTNVDREICLLRL